MDYVRGTMASGMKVAPRHETGIILVYLIIHWNLHSADSLHCECPRVVPTNIFSSLNSKSLNGWNGQQRCSESALQEVHLD